MRTQPPSLLPLFRSQLQVRLLALLLLNESRWWTTDELQRRLNAPTASVHRELHRSLAAGIVEREAIGKSFCYRAATASPLYEPLRTLLDRTIGLETRLREALASMPRVQAAAVYGSYARGTHVRPNSDVDVLVLGDVDPREVRRAVRPLEAETGREIDVLVYAPAEFEEMVKRGSSFARSVVANPLTVLVGSHEDFLRGPDGPG